MDKNKLIIIGVIIVIVALIAGLAIATQSPTKKNVKLAFENKKTIDEGGKVKIKLTDMNGTPIKGQTVNISITDKKGTTDYHSVVTNEKGVGKLKLDKDPGKYTVNCTYGGNENYAGNNTTQKLKIEKSAENEVVSTEPQSEVISTDSSSADEDPYAGMYEEYTDENGGLVQQFNWGDGSVEKIYEDGHYEMSRSDGSVDTGYYPN